MCPVLHNQINLGNNVLYNLLDYGNEYIENLTSTEIMARNSLSVIDASINEKIILRQELSEDGKKTSLKNTRRNDIALIINATESTNNREIEIDE